MEKKPYKGKYPSAAHFLISEGVAGPPRQKEQALAWAEGIDITYTLKNLTPMAFRKYADSLLLLAYQDAMRYEEYRWKFALFDVKLGRLKKGRDLPEVVTFQAHMHDESDIMVYGPGYDVPQKIFLKDMVENIKDLTRRYGDRINKQAPYKVTKLTISIRQPRPREGRRELTRDDG